MGIYLRVFAGLAINITPTSFYPSQDSCSLRVSPLRIIRLLPLVFSLFSARLGSFKKLVVDMDLQEKVWLRRAESMPNLEMELGMVHTFFSTAHQMSQLLYENHAKEKSRGTNGILTFYEFVHVVQTSSAQVSTDQLQCVLSHHLPWQISLEKGLKESKI